MAIRDVNQERTFVYFSDILIPYFLASKLSGEKCVCLAQLDIWK